VHGDHLGVRLISDTQALIPGATQQIGVLFTPDPGWHLYGPSRNDSGLPILLRPSAPDGFTFHPALWPTPHRLVSEGGILDHVYPDEVTIILPLDVPASERPGETVTLSCHVEWLVCGTGCIPGQGELQINLPVAERGGKMRPSSDDAHIRAALSRIPAAQEKLASDATLSWNAEAWNVIVPGAISLVFYPDTSCAPLRDPIRDAMSTSDRLSLGLAPNASPGVHMAGILEVATPGGTRFYQIDSPRPVGRAGL
jgi:DsbC/DsbD-like thiol-disulfide interchange protein